MKYRKLGHTGLDVSAVACGSWQLGGKRWRGLSDKDTVSFFHTCLDRGINLYDVSTAYGQYEDEAACFHSRSQELLGRAFEDKREEVIINLKLGHLDEYTHRRNFTPSYLIRSFKQSLKRLRTDYADICLIHAPSIADIEAQQSIRVLQTLQELGLVGAIGYSLENEPEHLRIALKQDIDIIELQYNLISQECGEAIEEARKHGIGIIASGVYKRGLLTGRFRHLDDLPLQDEYWQYNRNLCEGKLVSLLETTRNLLDQYGSPLDLRKAALGFVLDHPGVSTAVMGHRAVKELDENIELANQCLNESSAKAESSPIPEVEEAELETA
ncbi:aldo/keto reductase [Puniceicoccaceae bacterium K14]|nr:aldo/keto reductase [Puniceicoccaceae bacterium K14]